MPLCAFGDVRMRADHTQIENAFLRDFMPHAAGDAVKVYLYGLMQCQHGTGEGNIAAFARALQLTEQDIHDAFLYWQACGLVRISSQPSFSVLYQSAQHAMPLDNSLYTQSEMNAQLQSLFLPQLITPADMARIYEWTDVFRVQVEAVVMLINYGRSKMPSLEKATVSRQLRYIDKIARQWADEGIRTPEQAEVWLQAQQHHSNGLTSLLNRLGLHRNPTQAERKLYQKWLQSGFSDQAIALSADRTAGIRNPSFESIDNILSDLARQGAQTPEQVSSENSQALCREALCALGLKQPTPSASQLDAYRQLTQQGHTHERILLACELCRDAGNRTMGCVAGCLARWGHNGLSDGKSIRAFEAQRMQAATLMDQAFACMGSNRRATEADIEQHAVWTKQYKFSDELILFAAESSHGANSPYRLMKKLLQDWHEAGIRSVSAARKQTHAPSSAKNPALNYPQREVADPDEGVDWL